MGRCFHPELSKAPETMARIRKRIASIKSRQGSLYALEMMSLDQEVFALELQLSQVQGNASDHWNQC